MSIVKKISLPSVVRTKRLHTVMWIPQKEVKAVLQIVHGMVEYVERYEPFAKYLNQSGIAVIGHDQLGHGYSAETEKDLGFFCEKDGDRAVILDILQITKYAKKQFPNVPFFLMGHSMGSFFVRNYIMKFQETMDGVILMGTGYHSLFEARFGECLANGVIRLMGAQYRSRLIDQLILGSYNRKFAPNRTKFDWISSDEHTVDQYLADPFCTFKFTAGAYRDFFRVLVRIAAKENRERIPKDVPIYLVSGQEDPVGNFGLGVKKLYSQLKKIGVKDVSITLFPGARHEILNEKQREIVFAYLKKWLNSHIN